MPEPVLTSEFFINNRQRLRNLFRGTAPIVLTAAGNLQRLGDTNYPFIQDSSFFYLTGITESDVILVIDKDKEYLIVPERDHAHEVFDGGIGHGHLTEVSGIEEVLDAQDGWKKLSQKLKRVKHVATLAAPPSYFDFYAMYTNPARGALISKLKEANPQIDLLDIRQHLSKLRVIKQPIELDAIQTAINITNQTLKSVAKPSKLGKYRFEYEIEADINASFRKHGADGNAFSTIVASGANATTIHHMPDATELKDGDLLLMDVGADYHHYAADITRTYAIGKIGRRAREIHEAVYEIQEFAISLLKPGLLINNFEKEVENFLGEKLRVLGLIKSIKPEDVRPFMPHRVSHFLGLDPHDIGDYEKPLEEGMVLTCEPGIYIPDEKIGVRIEDDLLITKTGNRLLSGGLPRRLE